MPLEGSYAIWNNRGGSGKTTLTYHLANKFAVKHPDKTILLIDMCPQADLSHALLGDDEQHADYVNQLGTLRKDPMLIGDQKIPKTVSGYLDLCTSQGLPSNVDPRTFLLNVSKFNSQLARNLYLLCGDASLELMARSLEEKRNQLPSLSQFGPYAWKSVTTSLKQFIKKIAERKGIKLVVFIDCNSSFSILTEIALAASDKLLIPITEDHLHRNGFEYMFALLYGFSQPSNVYYYYRHFSFYYRANQHDVKLPKIHLILNRLSKASSFSMLASNASNISSSSSCNFSMSTSHLNKLTNDNNASSNNESEWEFIFDVFKKHPQAFNIRNGRPLLSLGDFKDEFVLDLCEQAASNEIVRLAVKSHSPLLNIKNPNHNNNNNNNNNNSNTSTTPSSTSTLPAPTSGNRINRSLSPTNQNSNNLTTLRRVSLNIHPKTLPTTAQQQPSTMSTTTAGDLGANNFEPSNAILFDKLLDKIVDGLMM